MKREILFRGKRKDGGFWLCGDLRQWSKTRKGIHDYALKTTSEVDPETVGQFTGLTDRTGKKIFEGDIFECRSPMARGGDEIFHAVVFWDEHRWSYRVIYNNHWTEEWNNYGHSCDLYKSPTSIYCSVIGNIHDNPELLEG